MTTKIVALVDALGNLVRFHLLPGQRHDTIDLDDLIKGIQFDAFLGDKAFDSDRIREVLSSRDAEAVIPPKAGRKVPIPFDSEKYKWRHLVENYFCKIKEFRQIATRYEKTDTSYRAMLHLVGSVLASK